MPAQEAKIMQERYSDDQLARMCAACEAIRNMISDGTLRNTFRGKELLLDGEIERELRQREEERRKAEAEAVPEPIPDESTQKNENPAPE